MNLLVLDIGGSSIKIAVMDETCHIITRDKVTTPMDKMDTLFTCLDDIWNRHGNQVEGLAISMPGVIDSEHGFAYTGGALRYLENRPFAKELSKRYHVPVWIGNDAKCAAIAEVGYGALQGVRDAIVVILGTGIGGCLIKDGKVHNGKHFSSGEVSSLHLDVHHPIGETYNWWRISGILGLREIAQRYLETDEELSGEAFFQFVNEGNEKANAALKEYATSLAVALFNIQAIYDGESIAIGGGISAQPKLIEEIKTAFIQIAKNEPVYVPEIVPCAFRNDANLIGAYYQYHNMKLSDQ